MLTDDLRALLDADDQESLRLHAESTPGEWHWGEEYRYDEDTLYGDKCAVVLESSTGHNDFKGTSWGELECSRENRAHIADAHAAVPRMAERLAKSRRTADFFCRKLKQCLSENSDLRAENARLRAEAQRFYHSDGTFEDLPADEVVDRRIRCAKDIDNLRAENARMREALEEALDARPATPEMAWGASQNMARLLNRALGEEADGG